MRKFAEITHETSGEYIDRNQVKIKPSNCEIIEKNRKTFRSKDSLKSSKLQNGENTHNTIRRDDVKRKENSIIQLYGTE